MPWPTVKKTDRQPRLIYQVTADHACNTWRTQTVSKHTEDSTVSFSLQNMLWLFRPLEQGDINLLTYLLTGRPANGTPYIHRTRIHVTSTDCCWCEHHL